MTWTIDQVMHRLLPEAVVGEWSDPSGQLVLVERVLPEAWAGKALRDLGMPGKVNVVAVTRAGMPRLEVADLVGQEGDVLHLAVLKDAVGELERRFDGGEPRDARRAAAFGVAAVKVAIAGAGNVGTAIAKDLAANGHDVLLIERDPDLVERLRPTVDVTWVAADACEVELPRRGRAWPRSTWPWRPPATTRTTW